MDDEAAKAFDIARKELGFMLARTQGEALVDMVFSATRAKLAGLEETDVICAINNAAILTTRDFAIALSDMDFTQEFSIEVRRSGENLKLKVPSTSSHRIHFATHLDAEQKTQDRSRGVVLESCQFANSGRNIGDGSLRTTPSGIEFVAQGGYRHIIPWSEIVDIQVATSETSRVTFSRVFLIGLFALAAKKKQSFTVLEVETGYTTFAFVTTESQIRVVETVRPLIAHLRQSRTSKVGSGRLGSDIAPAPPSPVETPNTAVHDLSKQIRDLAKLRDEGLITVDEFTLAKAKILGL